MYLQATVYPATWPPHRHRLPSNGSSLCSGITPGWRLRAPLIRTEWRQCGATGAVRCSASKFYNYGTVDYERRPALKWSTLYRRISTMENVNDGSSFVLDRWEDEERKLSKWELFRVIKELRKFGRLTRALEIYEWMASQGDRFTYTSSDKAVQLDLIAKVHGISHAEDYFAKTPDLLKDKRVYGALLHAYSQSKFRKKAEATLETMKAKGYAYDALPYNVMMTFYMNIEDHDMVNSMINEMKERNVNFDVFTYNIWITNCATVGNMTEMERVVQEMTTDSGVIANWTTYTTLATMYIRLGDIDKALNGLREAERRMTSRDRSPFHYLLGLYGSIGKRDEVYRIWNRYKSAFPVIMNSGYQSMLSSLVKLGDTEGVEKIYDGWLSTSSKLDPRLCNLIMRCYVREGYVSKAKSVLDRFVGKGGKPKPLSWEILFEGFLKGKQLPEALSCMESAASYDGVSNWQPKPDDVANILALSRELGSKESVEILIDVLRRSKCHDKEEYVSLFAS
ncbi:Pentatricopeptide repeat-containing protein [Apostasia shenzhenica]|uniref:Pentatricopeptide repeat-containing protein n=1 Tax=Apostasia shenzhenica TaxID=1088818 RepID=A0A2I0A451_9ASPA|nr:Pentatricopeptide repeat-containing protein [Apostasia shenzhenica]